MFTRSSKKQFCIDILMICLGTIIMGFAFSFFLSPNNISTGGFSGLAMIINELLGLIGITFLSNGVIYFLLNIVLFFIALKTLGKKFAIKAVIGIASYSLFMEIFELIPQFATYEPLISSIYGGILMGTGLGLVVRFGGSTGGTDMIACVVRSKKPQFSIGQIVVMIDIFVVLASMFVFPNGLELLPYTVIALAISIYTTDFVNDGYKKVKAYYIITTKPEEISNKVMEKLGRGCTMQVATGMRNKSERAVLTCLVSKFQATMLRRIIKDIDEGAFVYSTNVNEVIGEWTKAEEIQEAMINENNLSKKTAKAKKVPNSKKDKEVVVKETIDNENK